MNHRAVLRRLKVLIGIVTLYDTTYGLFRIWLNEAMNTVIHARNCKTHHSNDIVVCVCKHHNDSHALKYSQFKNLSEGLQNFVQGPKSHTELTSRVWSHNRLT